MNILRPKVELYAKKYGTNDFNKYCFFAFRQKFRDNFKPSLGKIFTVVIFCLDQDYPDQVLNKFSTDFINSYESAIVEEKDFNKIQNYRLKQNIMIQYYDVTAKISVDNPVLPNFYTSFSKEGLVLNQSPDYDPNKVKFSFRFDQVVKCKGGEASTLKQVLNPVIAGLFKDDECCISYLVDWSQKGSKNMFCSMFSKKWKCKADIKIFQSTLYHYCLEQQIEKIKKTKNAYGSLNNAKMYFLERAAIISSLKDVEEYNLNSVWDKMNYFYQIVVEEKKSIKDDLYLSLQAFDKEIGNPKSGSLGGCKELLGKLETEKNESRMFF